jgi:hypothetical protein
MSVGRFSPAVGRIVGAGLQVADAASTATQKSGRTRFIGAPCWGSRSAG